MLERSRRKPRPLIPLSPRRTAEGVIQRPQGGAAQTEGFPAATLSAGHCSCQHIPGQPGAPTPQGHQGNRRLYIISRLREAPARLGDGAALVPSLSRPHWAVRRRCAGRRGGTPGTHWCPEHRTELGVGNRGRVPSPATRGARREGRGPTLPAACMLQARPSRLRPGPPRGAPVTRLT